MSNIKPQIQEAQKPKQDTYQTLTPLVTHIFNPLNTKTENLENSQRKKTYADEKR